MVVRWHKLGEVENEYTSEKLVLFAIFVRKISTIGRNLTKFWQQISLHSFFRHGVLLSTIDSVCLSLCHKLQIAYFFFVSRWNRALNWPSVLHDPLYKTIFFDLGPLTPKIYSPKLLAITLHFSGHNFVTSWTTCTIFAPNRAFWGAADSMEPCKMLRGRPLLPRQRNLGCYYWLLLLL